MRWYGLIVRFGCCVLFATWFGMAQASIGKVLEVKNQATITSAGKTVRAVAGMAVDTGDIIKTDGSGIVQLVFDDETKIAVGPNSSITLDVSMKRGKKRASRFAVEAIGGSFRFISGKSQRRAYSVSTPTATMGIRGTIFDIWVLSDRQTSMAILEGSVRMCGRSGRCSRVRGTCTLAATTPRGNIGRPSGTRQSNTMLSAGFPFILSQQDLRPQLHAPIEGCGRHKIPPNRMDFSPATVIPTLKVSQPPPSDPPPPDPPPPPPSDPPPPDEPTPPDHGGSGFPGQSGDEGPSQGRGGGVSDGQNGVGTGKGQGAENRGGKNQSNGQDSGSQGSNGKGKGSENGKGGSRGKSGDKGSKGRGQ